MSRYHLSRLACLALLVAQIAGCRALSKAPDKTIVRKFANVDALVITNQSHSFEVTDQAAIKQLQSIYEQAKWKPYVATMPSGLSGIQCLRNGEELFSLSFSPGAIWDSIDYYAELDEESRNWLNQLAHPHPAN